MTQLLDMAFSMFNNQSLDQDKRRKVEEKMAKIMAGTTGKALSTPRSSK